MSNSDAPGAVKSYERDDDGGEILDSHVSLRSVDEADRMERSGVVDVSGFRDETASGVRTTLRLVKPENILPDRVSIEGMEKDEDVLSVMEEIRSALGRSWDVLLEISETCGVTLRRDSVGGQKVNIKAAGSSGLLVSLKNNKRK